MKVIINSCFGGFELSLEVLYRAIKENIPIFECYEYGDERGSHDWDYLLSKMNKQYKEFITIDFSNSFLSNSFLYDEKEKKMYLFKDFNGEEGYKLRTNPDLIKIVEELGEKANGKAASLSIIEIPDDVDWIIEDYDGIESIHEKHRVWP